MYFMRAQTSFEVCGVDALLIEIEFLQFAHNLAGIQCHCVRSFIFGTRMNVVNI